MASRLPGNVAGQRASLSLEMAMSLPLIAMVAWVLIQLVSVGSDALLAQEVAAIGARTAVTTTDDAEVLEAVATAVGDRPFDVKVDPTPRRAGDLVRVRVRIESSFGPLKPVVSGRAVARGEQVLGP